MVNSFSTKNRAELIQQLHHASFDVLVIGGGITGAGIALDAASRGLKVILVDMQDFAAGTSSRSTKLIHGGLRYLKQLEFKLVSEVGKEREIIHKNAPHLSTPDPMLLPITKNGAFGKFSTRLAMWVYEYMAGVKREERHKVLNVNEVANIEPCLKKENLLGGILYYEYRTDDARLTMSVLKEAVHRGAVAINYMKVTGFNYKDGIIIGAKVEDQVNKNVHTIYAKYVINASGPWVDELDSLDDKAHGHKLKLTKGVHLVVPYDKLPIKQSVYFDTYDERMIFVIPRDGKTYIGTTDTFYDADKLNPATTLEDKTYLLKCVNDYFDKQTLRLSDIESCWAGIRPLIKKPGKKPSEISRKDEIFEWESGLITIAGGKLTGYRKMAQNIVDLIAKKIAISEHKKLPICSTHHIILSGGNIGQISFPEFIKNKTSIGLTLGINAEEAELLIHRYGSEINALFTTIKTLKEKEGTEHYLSLLLRAELLYAIEHEMCMTPSDFFIRRTGMLYFDIDKVKKYEQELCDYMQEQLNWDNTTYEKHKNTLHQAIQDVQSI